MEPSRLPIVEVILESENPPPPSFSIGNDEEWLVEWRKMREGDNFPVISREVTTRTLPFLMRTRNGWYLDTDPLHLIARKMITPAVSILVLAFFLRAIAPALEDRGFIGGFLDFIWISFSIGPIDYPLFLIIGFPIFISPIILRMVANLRDIKRQEKYVKNPLSSPIIDLLKEPNTITINEWQFPEGVTPIRARIQVGIAVPERSTVLAALGKSEQDQTSPGLSTALPERRIATAEEHGTGVGEATPMTISHRRMLLLEPMRVMKPGQWKDELNTPFSLNGPTELWPGSIYSALIAVHWELIVECEKVDGSIMKWVRPLEMENSHLNINLDKLPVQSGRTELIKN